MPSLPPVKGHTIPICWTAIGVVFELRRPQPNALIEVEDLRFNFFHLRPSLEGFRFPSGEFYSVIEQMTDMGYLALVKRSHKAAIKDRDAPIEVEDEEMKPIRPESLFVPRALKKHDCPAENSSPSKCCCPPSCNCSSIPSECRCPQFCHC